MDLVQVSRRVRHGLARRVRAFARSSRLVPIGLDWAGMGAKATPGGRAFDPGRKTVLIVCHETTRTGAPILGWNLAKHLAETHNVISFIVYPGGDLREVFAEQSVLVAGPFRRRQLLPLVMHRFLQDLVRRMPLDYAILNSIESYPVAPALARLGVPTVTLIHEFATNVAPGQMTSGLMLSTQAVFDAEVQRQAALDEWPGITTRCQHVFHQGASEVPRFSRAERPAARSVSLREAMRGPQDKPVVLGLGTICMRKGVDLFVSCAQAVANVLGPDQVRFVWIGDRPQPHPDGLYCDWISDQVKRAGLDRSVIFLDVVDDLSSAFAAAEAVFVSSRLDPFPNVAMDAALAGIPIVCFDRANGFADYLAADPRTAELAIPYLDVHAAAAELVGLLGDAARRDRLGRVLRENSARDFPMTRYLDRLAPIVETAKAIAAQERRDIDLLTRDETFSAFLWCDPHERLSREEAIRLHVRKAASGQEANQYCRRPALGFVPQTYADHHEALNAVPFENPLAHWIRAGKPAGPWSHRVLVPSSDTVAPKAGGTPRAALHIHLHYPELADGILAHLRRNMAALDLFVSTDSTAKAADLEQRFAAYRRGPVVIRTGPNRGRDIGPMLTLFGRDLQAYDVVGHFHGKRSLALTSVGLSTSVGVRWYEFLLQHLIGDKFPMVDLILGRFAASPKLGLVFPEDPNLTGWSLDRALAIELAARMDPAMAVPPSIDFPIGTMFWMRPQALKPLFDLGLDWPDYPAEPVPIDGTMLHAFERLLPVICEHEGFEIETTHIPGVGR